MRHRGGWLVVAGVLAGWLASACARPLPMPLPAVLRGPDGVPEATIRLALSQRHWLGAEADWFVSTVPVWCAGPGDSPANGYLGPEAAMYVRVDCQVSRPTLLQLVEHEARHAHDDQRSRRTWPAPELRRDVGRLADAGMSGDPAVDLDTRLVARRVLRLNRTDDAHLVQDMLDGIGHQPLKVPRWFCLRWVTMWDARGCPAPRWSVLLPALTG